MRYRHADIDETIIVCNVFMSDIRALSFCVAVVDWRDLLAFGREKWPHGHRLAAIGKGSRDRVAGKCKQHKLTVNNNLQVLKYRLA